MYKTSFRVSLFVIILMLPCAVMQAAGLGKLTLNSALGQPLNAEIDIVATNSDEVQSLKASVATREAYTQAGINYESILSSVKASIESRINGNPYIKLTSPQAVNDPFLMILMELNWASGRILREYTVLLDPVEANTQNLAAASSNPAPRITVTRLDGEKSSGIEKNNQAVSSSKSKNGSSSQTKKNYGPVNRGDTLSSIARQVLPAGADLNQMLVALYRANRGAFIADNMNLLKAGVVLKIPERSEVTAIDTSTAKAEIKTQIGDWRNYQGKLAVISRESWASHTISQSDHGQITTNIDKKSIAASGTPKEVLKLSSGAQLIDKNGQIAESTLVDRLRMMEEDAVARNLALQEANQRVVMLEKSIENMKQLLELKDSVLAQAQTKAESVTRQPEVRSPVTVNPLTAKDPKLGMDSPQVQEARVIQPATEAMIQNTTVSPSQSPDETAERSLTDQLFDYIEYIGAASILVLLLTLLVLKRRRDQLKADVEEDDAMEKDFSSSMQSRMASMAAAQSAMSPTDTNQSASEEVEDDLTYENINSYSGTEEQDETFDKNTTSFEEDAEYVEKSGSHPASISESWVEDKLLPDNLQQDVDTNSKEDFEEDYSQFTDSSQKDGSADFSNEIDFDLSDETDEGKKNLALNQSFSTENSAKQSAEFPDDSESLKEANVSDDAIEINFDESEQLLDSVNSNDKTAEKDNEGIDFDLTNLDIDLMEEESANEIEVSKMTDESSSFDSNAERSGVANEPLEFDQSQEIASDTVESESLSKMPELELADINLDLEDTNPVDEKVEKADLSDTSDEWQEIETKLDLAKAYLEMDDKEGAKEMLEEVVRDGDTKQQKAAKKMLKSL